MLVLKMMLCSFFDWETEIGEPRLHSRQRSFHRVFRPLVGQCEGIPVQTEELIVFCEKSFFNLGAFWMPIDQFDSECGSLEVTCDLF
jgi:hypothetical protein